MIDGTTIETSHFKRVTCRMPVKLLIGSVVEVKGIIINMSAGEMAIASRHPVKTDDEIIAYINGTDRFKGIVSRHMGNVFSVKMKLPKAKQFRIVEMLTTELARRDGIIGQNEIVRERRGALRRRCAGGQSACILSDGNSVKCSVLDVSLTGLSIEIDPVLKIGEIVRVGKINARVVRQTPTGYGLELLDVETSSIAQPDGTMRRAHKPDQSLRAKHNARELAA